MKRLLSCAALFFVASFFPATAQTPTDSNEGSRLEFDSANQIYRFKWWGKTGRTYFIQHGEDLTNWNWVPVVEPGNDSVKEWGFTTTGTKFFARLKYWTDPTSDPEGDDFDQDGVPNLYEVQHGNSPFVVEDSDNDGFPDGWLTLHAGKFAIYPPSRLQVSIPKNQTANRTIYLHNDTATPVTYSLALANQFAPAYGFEDSVTGGAVYAWEDISTTGALLASVSSADDNFEEVALTGFSFPFFGVNYNSVFVSSNGLLAFGSGDGGLSNTGLPSTSAPPAILAPFWDDLNPGAAGDIYFLQEANRAIIQYQDVSRFGGGGTYTFQVVLHSDGRIQFRYKTLTGALDSCTVGTQDATRTFGFQMAFNAPYLADGLAIEISPQASFLSVNPVSGTVPAYATQAVTATFRSLTIPFGTYTATVTTTHSAPDIAGPHVISATLQVVNAPATVSLTSPAAATSILEGNSVQLAATATDPDGMASVQFYDGAAQIVEVGGSGPYASTWNNPSVGTHPLIARSIDSYGAPTDSAPVTLVVLPDADSDQMADDWEVANGLNPTVDDSLLDLDGDGAFNRFEYASGTVANDAADTPPNTPATIAITSPTSGASFVQWQTISVNASASDPDTGVSQIELMKDGTLEYTANSTNLSYEWTTSTNTGPAVLTAVAVDNFGHRTASAPVSITILPDSDHDGMPDAWETQYGLNPASATDAAGDLDNDGYTNLEEYQLGKNPTVVEDTDSDGIPDGKERKLIYRTSDGRWDFFNLNSTDSDNNGIADGQEDYDLDGLTVLQEIALGTDPNKTDTDADGVNDGKEVNLGSAPLVADAWATQDTDGDGLTDLFEINFGTSHQNADTNGNGMNDKDELDNGGDPIHPGTPPPVLPPPLPPGTPERPNDPPPTPPTPITPGQFDILVEIKSVSFTKYGHSTFQVLDPPKRFLTMSSTQSFRGGNPESGPRGFNGSTTTEINPLTGQPTTTGDSFVNTGGDAQSPVRRGGTSNMWTYDDPPNDLDDNNAKVDFSTTLSGENTTQMMVTAGKGKLEAFENILVAGTPSAYRNVHENELHFDFQKVQFKFQWKAGVTAEQRYPVSYPLLFQPEDDPDTTDVDESAENAEVLENISWAGVADQSQMFTIDPEQRKPGVDGSYRLLSLEIGPDAGMVGVVGDMVPSNKGLGGEKHFVTPKKSAQIDNDYVTFSVTGVSAAVFQKLFEWGPEGEAVPGEPLKRRVSRDAAAKTAITVQTKGTSQEVAKLNVWVVWATPSLVNLPAAVFYPTTGIDLVDGTTADRINFVASTASDEKLAFEFKIEPATMFDLTSDVPDLRGAPISNTPGGANPLKPQESLATGGASAKWDPSRSIQITITNPNIPRSKYPQSSLLPDNPAILAGQPNNGIVLAFPSDDVTGNDDSSGTGLGGDPYAVSPAFTPDWLEHGIGYMRSDDRPSSSISNFLTNGGIYEERDEFREFLRLNIGTKWYRVSSFQYWEFRLRTRNDNGNMVNDGSYSGTSL